jgi:4-alpha-glucanotransferase
MTGTHDTETLTVWWERASLDERRVLFQLPAMHALGFHDPHEPWSDRLRDALLALAWQSSSAELFVPFQDLFGWQVRINVPATVNESNWTWRLPWPVDALSRQPESTGRAEVLRALTAAAGRGARPV